jgi:polyisoprenoid-binding protein YceI
MAHATALGRRRAGRRLVAWALPSLLLLAATPAFAQARPYELDPVHTRVMFALSHAGYSQAIGTVSGSTGTFEFDPRDWRGARVEVSVPLARLDLGDAKWNKAALAANLLNARDYPVATFSSTRVEPIDARRASLFGTLTLHGVAREVKLDVTFNRLKRYPLPPFRRTVGFSATTAISRKDFGIDAWPTVIGDRVELRIEAEGRRARSHDEPADAQQSPAGDEREAVPPEEKQDASPPEGDQAAPPRQEGQPASPVENAEVIPPPQEEEPSPLEQDEPRSPADIHPRETPPPAGEGEPVTPAATSVVIPSAARDLPRTAASVRYRSLATLGLTATGAAATGRNLAAAGVSTTGCASAMRAAPTTVCARAGCPSVARESARASIRDNPPIIAEARA